MLTAVIHLGVVYHVGVFPLEQRIAHWVVPLSRLYYHIDYVLVSLRRESYLVLVVV